MFFPKVVLGEKNYPFVGMFQNTWLTYCFQEEVEFPEPLCWQLLSLGLQ